MPYGEVDTIRPEIIDRVATGTLFMHVDVTKDIPSRLRIQGHNFVIWYHDQPAMTSPEQQGRCQMVPRQFSWEPGTPLRLHPPTPLVSPACSPLGPPDPPQLWHLATAVAMTLPNTCLHTTTVTLGHSYVAIIAQEPSTFTSAP